MNLSYNNDDSFNKTQKLMESMSSDKKELSLGKIFQITKVNENTTYGVLKENASYVIKKIQKGKPLIAENFEYIDGYEARRGYTRDTLQECIKYMHLLINESKYVLPVTNPTPVNIEPPQNDFEVPNEEEVSPEPSDNPEIDGDITPQSDENSSQEDTLSSDTGKLAQELRTKIESGEEKLTVGSFKSILAAAKNLSPESKEEVLNKANDVLSTENEGNQEASPAENIGESILKENIEDNGNYLTIEKSSDEKVFDVLLTIFVMGSNQKVLTKSNREVKTRDDQKLNIAKSEIYYFLKELKNDNSFQAKRAMDQLKVHKAPAPSEIKNEVAGKGLEGLKDIMEVVKKMDSNGDEDNPKGFSLGRVEIMKNRLYIEPEYHDLDGSMTIEYVENEKGKGYVVKYYPNGLGHPFSATVPMGKTELVSGSDKNPSLLQKLFSKFFTVSKAGRRSNRKKQFVFEKPDAVIERLKSKYSKQYEFEKTTSKVDKNNGVVRFESKGTDKLPPSSFIVFYIGNAARTLNLPAGPFNVFVVTGEKNLQKFISTPLPIFSEVPEDSPETWLNKETGKEVPAIAKTKPSNAFKNKYALLDALTDQMSLFRPESNRAGMISVDALFEEWINAVKTEKLTYFNSLQE